MVATEEVVTEAVVRRVMEKPYPLEVPLGVGVGRDCGDAH